MKPLLACLALALAPLNAENVTEQPSRSQPLVEAVAASAGLSIEQLDALIRDYERSRENLDALLGRPFGAALSPQAWEASLGSGAPKVGTEVTVHSQPGAPEVRFVITVRDLETGRVLAAPEVASWWGQSVNAKSLAGDYELVFQASTTAQRGGTYFFALHRGGRAVLSHTLSLPESEPTP